ncbi:MAG: pentapeptide repeat-containing protein, partial [Actinomycetota bacterium]
WKSSFVNADLRGARLNGAQLHFADLRGALVDDIVLDNNTNLTGTLLEDSPIDPDRGK